MDSMIKEYILSFIRNMLGPVAVWLAASGYVTEQAAGQLMIAIAGVLVAVIWSLINKFLWKKTAEGALQHPSSTSSTVLQDVIANSGATTK